MSGPHDLLVRYTFENPERAAAELRVALPPFVVAQVDWSSLKAERNSVVDPELRETETDLLFSARLKDGRCSSTCCWSTSPRWNGGWRCGC